MNKNNNQIHGMLLALVGGYLLYIAYHLFENQTGEAPDLPLVAAVAAIAVFAIAGIGVLFYAWKVYRTKPEQDDGQDEHAPKG